MDKFYKKLLLLSCVLLVVVPSFLYANYESLKIEGSTDVTKGVEFQIRVTACDGSGNKLTESDPDWDSAKRAYIYYECSDPEAEIKNNLGKFVSLAEFNDSNPRLWQAERPDTFILKTVGKRTIRVLEKNILGIEPGSINLYVHKYVDHFQISLVELSGNRTAGVPFDIEIRALNEDGNLAKTFNNDVAIWAIMWPEDYSEPTMFPQTISGTSFTNGKATVSATIYGSHPDTRNVKIKCENTVMHGEPPYYAKGVSGYFSINPASYQSILLIAPGEEYEPGTLGGGGKESLPITQTVGKPFDVKVYTVDQYWNPVQVNPAVTVEFTSSDPEAILPSPPETVMDRNPKTFSLTLKKVSVDKQKIEVTEGSKKSVSMIPVQPADTFRFQFDTVPSPQKTTESFTIRITAYDEFNNVANYNQNATLGTNYGPDYVTPKSVKFTNGVANPSVQVTRAGNKFQLSVTDGTHINWSNEFDVKVGALSKLLVLLEGETHTPGLGSGKSGSPNSIYAGQVTTATIYACDSWWNPTSNNIKVTFASTTGYIEAPSSLTLEDGYGRCLVKFRTAYEPTTRTDEPQTVTVTSSGLSGTSSQITIRLGSYQNIVLVAPGERLDPGTSAANGKSGSLITQVAGTSFTLTVAATDAYWNPISSGFPSNITFTSGDTNANVRFGGQVQGTSLSMGARIKDFSSNILITLANPQWVKVSDVSKNGQVNIRVIHGSLDHFAFNTSSGSLTAGTTIYNVTITAQDKYNNTVESFNSSATLESNTGANTYTPTSAPFTNGQSIINVIIYKAQDNVTLTCKASGKTGVSNSFNVTPGPYAKLVLILPGQSHEPGNIVAQGKSGIPLLYKVGNPAIQTIVYAVDTYWNRVYSPAPVPNVKITTNHYFSVEPGSALLGDGKAIFWTTLKTAATGQILLAIDRITGISDTSKIDVNPGDFVKLQIVAPGEITDPGSDLGKTGTIQPQVAGVSFDLMVRAVDQYWNVVPTNGESIDLTSVEDPGLEDRYSPKPFASGVTSFRIWLDGNGENINVKAYDRKPAPPQEHTVRIYVERGHKYVVEVPTFCIAGVGSPNVFSMTVKLVDESNKVVTDANNWFKMVPCLAADHSSATDPQGLGQKGINLINGVRTFDQSYPIVEPISIAVSDDFGRGPMFSSAIDVRETGLRYKIDVPTAAIAGGKFGMTVSLIDIGTGNVVPTRDREVSLVAVSAGGAGGRLYVTNVGLSKGICKITNQWYTKAETISIKASDAAIYQTPAETKQSDPFLILPGELKKLQILAPGEQPRPGEMAYIETGKDSSNIQVQGIEIDFAVLVYAVDQYWNRVDKFNGGIVYLSSEGSFSSDPAESSFNNGVATFINVTIHQAGSSFTLKAEAKSPTGLQPQSVNIPMEVATYRITSAVLGAKTVDSFVLTVELIDPETRLPKTGANNWFDLTACTVDCKDAPGKWTKMGGSLVLDNGDQQVLVNYDTVGKIRFKVTDSFGRPAAYTEPIDIKPVGLRYEIEAPGKVEAGKGFPLTVKLVDTGVGNLVTPKEYSRQVKLVACSSPAGTPAEGDLKVKTLYLEGGEITILNSYNIAHDIYIEASDAKTYVPPAALDRTADIEVIGAPKTVMKLDGVYNETNGALYLRATTVISILSTSDIVAETILYRDNDSNWETYVRPFTLSPGAHTIEYYGIDKYGHKEEINKSKIIYVSFFSESADGVINRPNPFRAGKQNTYIEYNLKEPSNVTITIYDLFGQEVWRKSYRAEEKGGSKVNSEPWDGRNLCGQVVGNGGYICRIWIEKEKRQILRKIGVAK